MSESARPANALIHESSPYLLQHAHNPVNWLAWGPEALEKARREEKLIFLSIGYAACHWCHVMEHESFEDEQVATMLNDRFVPIKVDREERPDLDEIYMSATMVFSGGHGGWPMSVFLAPDLRPVFAGTYFPKENAHGRPGFKTVLAALDQRWRDDREGTLEHTDQVVEVIRSIHGGDEAGEGIGVEQVGEAAETILRAFDPGHGGIPSGSNKFPPSMALDLFLRLDHLRGETRFAEAIERTLESMANGGIYDHLGGGLHRYSTDAQWLVPHFEKMLYDQALVAAVFIDGSQAARSTELRRLCADRARGICDYVLRDLTDSGGAFYSSEDADSEGLEGKFYLWTIEQIRELVDSETAARFASHYGATEFGNWMHPGDEHVPHGPKNILHVSRSIEAIARLESADADEVERRIADARRVLFEEREKRVRPALDDKILCGWNGLMIGAMAKAAAALPEPRYAEAAGRAADFILREMRRDGRLLAAYGKGRARLAAYSTDYAFMIEGLLELFEATGEFDRLDQARELTEVLLEHYWDHDGGAGFFFTAADHEELLVRSKTAQDGATPSANSVMAMNLLKLAVLTGGGTYRDRAADIVRAFGSGAAGQPFQSERLLTAALALEKGFTEVVVVGERAEPGFDALLAVVRGVYLPQKIVSPVRASDLAGRQDLPLFAGRGMIDGKATAWVCRDFSCDRPTTDPGEFAGQLGTSESSRAD